MSVNQGQEGPALILLEAVLHVLIEKGVLTVNDALSIVQTAAEVTTGNGIDREEPSDVSGVLTLLKKMYSSLETMETIPVYKGGDGATVHQLRPPSHGDAPGFPSGDSDG